MVLTYLAVSSRQDPVFRTGTPLSPLLPSFPFCDKLSFIGNIYKTAPNCTIMQKAAIVGNRIHCGDRSYRMDSVMGLTLSEHCLSLSMCDGSVLSVESDPVAFYSIGDRCPWVDKVLC